MIHQQMACVLFFVGKEKHMENVQLDNLYHLFLQDGLRSFKYKNSHLKPLNAAPEGKKGAIFAYRSKESMIAGRGVVLTSEEAIHENQDTFTHWTPNVYRYGTYTDANRSYTKGHSENNLRQINTFFIDFDVVSAAESMTSNDILLAAIDCGFMPTLILKSDKGYQAYFVLESPVYVTAKSEFKAIKAAKIISQNLREAFAKSLPVDLSCNHFGIARIPTSSNIEFFEPEYCYPFKQWQDWSYKQSDEKPSKPNLTVLVGTKGKRQIDEPWFDLLLHETKFEGKKGLIGRNNVLFTLALAYFSSGSSQETCEYNLLQFNERLNASLEEKELFKIIKSAYSEKYQAASREYILPLCQKWVSEDLTSKDLFVRQGWTKFKKPRQERVRSHLHEWKEDILTYLKQKQIMGQVYLETSKKAIREDLKIPERSLDKVLKELKAQNKLVYTVKSGRGGGIQLATMTQVLNHIITAKKEQRQQVIEELSSLFHVSQRMIQKALSKLQDKAPNSYQTNLFNLDTG